MLFLRTQVVLNLHLWEEIKKYVGFMMGLGKRSHNQNAYLEDTGML